MSIPRLTFLYPHLFKPVGVHETRLVFQPARAGSKPFQKAGISTTKTRRQETYAQRYGTAAEPHPPPGMPPGNGQEAQEAQDSKSLVGAIEKEVEAPAKLEGRKAEPEPTKEPEKPNSESKQDNADKSGDGAIDTTLQDPTDRAAKLDASESHPKETMDASTRNAQNARITKPLETVLQMGAPTVENLDEHKTPHLQAPPYVHHFDTFTLVKDLERGGFTQDQSVTLMKAVRSLLAINLDVAREGLVSKSDETYLFRAACSELRTEILNARKSSSTKTSTQLSHLQHTYDILSQRTSQETLALKDDLRGMLNDRRMAVRMQTQARDSEISELNYKISVALNSGSKSEVEGLRWVLTRRAAIGIAGMALLILGSLRYSTYKLHEREIQARKAGVAPVASQGIGTGGGNGGGGGFTVPSREMGTQTEQEALVTKGESVGYVSLG
ncbi:hypothetical protein MMC28_005733 [Mycoblastus sanguinarius]|nr:hypothetical protein [Mycoblastus sanguinarius]